MTPAPRRVAPKGSSPIRALRPEIESVFTAPQLPANPEEPAQAMQAEVSIQEPVAASAVSRDVATDDEPPVTTQPAAPTTPPQAPPSATSRPDIDWDEKKVTTLRVRRGLKAQAETAVLMTKKLEGGHKSWVALVDEALRRELARLADEFNGGVPFDPNTSEFQTGRLPGS